MAYTQDVRNQARGLYIDGGLSVDLVATQLNLSRNTVSAWKAEAKANGDDWEKLRAVNSLARVEGLSRNIVVKLLVNFEKSLDSLANAGDEIPPSEQVAMLADLAENFSRSVNANKKLMPQVHKFDVAMMVLEEMKNFIQESFPQLAEDFANVLEAFAVVLVVRLQDD